MSITRKGRNDSERYYELQERKRGRYDARAESGSYREEQEEDN